MLLFPSLFLSFSHCLGIFLNGISIKCIEILIRCIFNSILSAFSSHHFDKILISIHRDRSAYVYVLHFSSYSLVSNNVFFSLSFFASFMSIYCFTLLLSLFTLIPLCEWVCIVVLAFFYLLFVRKTKSISKLFESKYKKKK